MPDGGVRAQGRRRLLSPARVVRSTEVAMRVRGVIACVVFSGLAGLTLVAQDWPMWGGTPERNMTSAMKGLPDVVGRQERHQHQVEGADRDEFQRQPVVADGKIFLGHQQREPQEPRHHRRQGRADVLSRVRRPVPLAGGVGQAGVGRQRLARGRRLFVAGRRREAALLRHQPRRADLPRHGRVHRRGENDGPFQDETNKGADRRRRRVEARHAEGARHRASLHGELVAGRLGGSRVRRDLQRARQQRRCR